MDVEIRRLQPSDEQLALQVVRDIMPVEERNGREPTIGHLHRMLSQDSNYPHSAGENKSSQE